MDAKTESKPTATHDLKTERKSDRELVVTRTINGPARLVFEAWTTANLFERWWVPKSCGFTLVSCEMDVRVGGGYRLVFKQGDSEPMAFHGKYLEVTPPSRLAWSNDEGGEPGPITTVTFEERAGKTCVVITDLYPSKEALDAAMTSGAVGYMPETFDQLEELLASLRASR